MEAASWRDAGAKFLLVQGPANSLALVDAGGICEESLSWGAWGAGLQGGCHDEMS
jgi:hypothetical protein